MKTLILALLYFLPTIAFSQSSDSVITLIQERHIALNSGSRSLLGGKSRTYIKVDLPEHTKRWFYSFSTSSDYSGTNALNLALQVAGIVSSQGSLSNLVSYIKVPTGTGSADILLCDYENINKFMNKDDYWGKSIFHYTEGSVENTKDAVIAIDDVTSGTVYLGLRNPGSVDAIDIRIEVVAIVDFSPAGTWTKNFIDEVYGKFEKHLLEADIESSVAEELAKCMTEYLISNYSLEEASTLTEPEIKNLETEFISHCATDENTCEHKKQAETYGNLGWTYFENDKIDESIKYSKKALELCDQNMTWIEANIGLGYLVKDSIELSLEYYVQAITSSKNTLLGKQWIKSAIEDLELYESKYAIIKKHPEIKDLLKTEL